MNMQVHKLRELENSQININNIEIGTYEVANLITEIDSVFEEATKSCYTNFSPIGAPLVEQHVIDKFIDIYKETMPNHYKVMKHLIQIDKKENLTRNLHLTSYYDRMCFFQLLLQVRVSNNQTLVHFGVLHCIHMVSVPLVKKELVYMELKQAIQC